jgi:hypothetical protein
MLRVRNHLKRLRESVVLSFGQEDVRGSQESWSVVVVCSVDGKLQELSVRRI